MFAILVINLQTLILIVAPVLMFMEATWMEHAKTVHLYQPQAPLLPTDALSATQLKGFCLFLGIKLV